MEVLIKIFNATCDSFRTIFYGLNVTTTKIGGSGLLTVLFDNYLVEIAIENIGFRSDSIFGIIISNVFENPISKLLDFCSNKLFIL